uniref:Uncharacterized protein n=1 Tax=Octactis speculum TaxID=3111310 RepID=A0A7S2DBX3_9STRA|mmetsp:Transcript_46534/g.63375  ORF Transcript_46534/g.63375 Transcript_46534/m.63375 type:complete len:161 (+) Transcript_46534:445-927(+)
MSFVAFCCSTLLVVELKLVSVNRDTWYDDYPTPKPWNEACEFFLYTIVLGKEAVFLLIVLFEIATLNDTSDSITGILLEGRWGESGSSAESERLELIFSSSIASVNYEALNSTWRHYTTASKRPITFSVCATRPSRNLVLGAVGSFISSLVCLIIFHWDD